MEITAHNANNTPTKAMLWANRNGVFYVLDRTSGRFLQGTPFVKVSWMSGFDGNGRPIQTPPAPGEALWPGNQGGTNWYPPSFSPRTGLFYVSAWEDYAWFCGHPSGWPADTTAPRTRGGGHRTHDDLPAVWVRP